jgi:hypothetical protein
MSAVIFFKNENGFLGAEIDAVRYPRVTLTRALPLTDPETFVAVSNMDGKELVLLENLHTLPEESLRLAREELKLRYFCPQVSAVLQIKEKMGAYFVTLRVATVQKTVVMRDIGKNLRQLPGGDVLLTDADGNRFRVQKTLLKNKKLRAFESYLL